MDDYIKRSDALDRFTKIKESGVSLRDAVYLDGVMAVIENLPAVDVAPVVHARWEHVVHAVVDTTGNCSACKNEAVWRTRNSPYEICPHCGAKMDA